jgi:hypothetical protein
MDIPASGPVATAPGILSVAEAGWDTPALPTKVASGWRGLSSARWRERNAAGGGHSALPNQTRRGGGRTLRPTNGRPSARH